ncbi:hypothetical protein [Phyllobacterium pellucidum]|uniref:hypothetical protein n=1 Tax=Phyllobacterium pellucidum TaxID=2740464 RepID=UPI001D14B7A9|nr:hypothetical protein [Phyllobacterium sp. T1018]UGY11150.1 hypothetical protein LLE51_008345 [Phyllobacterium sp. T1018]
MTAGFFEIAGAVHGMFREYPYRPFHKPQPPLEAPSEREADLLKRAEAAEAKYREEYAIVDRVWKALGIESYEQAGGKEISELVADAIRERDEALKALEPFAKAADGRRADGLTGAVCFTQYHLRRARGVMEKMK